MKNKRLIYLAGAINGCTDKECKEWRERAKDFFGEENTLDPMRRDYRGKEMDCAEEIVEGDKSGIDASSVILVHYEKASVGTIMEILYAWERKKKVIVVTTPNARISPWLSYHSHKIFFTLDNALNYIGSEKK